MAIILPTGQWYAPSAVINDAWYCMALHGIALYCIELHGIEWYIKAITGLFMDATWVRLGITDDDLGTSWALPG